MDLFGTFWDLKPSKKILRCKNLTVILSFMFEKINTPIFKRNVAL